MYVYALSDDAIDTRGIHGVDGDPLAALRVGTLTAFTSPGVDAADPTPAVLESHNRVVSELMERATVLPLRFGTSVADEGALADAFCRRQRQLKRLLARVRDRVELGIRALWRDGPDASAHDSGRDFLKARLERRQLALHAADRIHTTLAGLAVDGACRVAAGDDDAVVAAYLVDRNGVARFKRSAEQLEVPGVDIVCTGPWPPYSFVREGGR